MKHENNKYLDKHNKPVTVGKIEKRVNQKNVVDPNDIIENYGADTARWFMLSDSPRTETCNGPTLG